MEPQKTLNPSYVEGARKRKEAKEKIAAEVDAFFAEKQVKLDNYVPREFKIKRLPNGLCNVYIEGGGEVPRVLSGNYTTIYQAQRDIDYYLCHNRA